ncbi:MAG: DUF4845 domain-containing protein [Halieaceae bacterium]|jgi:hypothetical protein|nr:DUF4845 domain-containing protein [Halieaceae bacterium]
MKLLHRQTGMSLPGLLSIAVMVGFFILCLIKLGPQYMEYLSVKKVVTTVATEKASEDVAIRDIRRRIADLFNTNQIRGLKSKEVKIYRKNGRMYIDANYESRVNIVGSVDAVWRFEDLKILVDHSGS